MNIDESKTLSLTNFRAKAFKRAAIKSDHNVLTAEFNIKYKKIKSDYRRTIFNYKCQAGLKKYFDLTSRKGNFTKYFVSDRPFSVQFKQWEKHFHKTLAICFRKVRLRRKPKIHVKMKVHSLMNKRTKAMKSKEPNISELEDEIKKEEAQMNKQKLLDNLKTLSETDANKGIWKLKEKYFPNNNQ